MIIGDGIRLRAAECTDIPKFVEWLNDVDVRQYLLIFYPMSLASEEKWFEDNVNRSPAEQVLVIEIFTESGWKAIGNTSLMNTTMS